MSEIEYLFLDKIDYIKALKFQIDKVNEIKYGERKNYLIFLEHNDVITKGIRAKENEILVDKKILDSENIQIIDTDRGGSLTAHGPGQLVIYTIFDLNRLRLNVRQFIDIICNSFILWLRKEGIISSFDSKHPGLYVNGKKILSLGLKLDNHITYHGFALNINSIPKGFQFILPCSMQNCQMTSVSLETSKKYDIRKVSIELYDLIRESFKQI